MTGFRATSLTATLALLVAGGVGFGLGGSASAGGTAQPQPSRLGAAADRVTFQARPLVVSSRGTRVTLSGSVSSGRAGEDIKIQAKDCGRDFFRVVSGAVTSEGGDWFQFYWPPITTTLRAIWNDATSAEVTIRRRAIVYLQRRSARRFEVGVYGRSVWRKRVSIQSFDRRLGTWRAVKPVVLRDSGTGGAVATFTVLLPKGTRIRAVFPRSQAGPCYLTGTSNTLTT